MKTAAISVLTQVRSLLRHHELLPITKAVLLNVILKVSIMSKMSISKSIYSASESGACLVRLVAQELARAAEVSIPTINRIRS